MDKRALFFNLSLNELESALIESFRNFRRVVEVFDGVFVLSPSFLIFFSVEVVPFVIGLSQISSFFLYVCNLRELQFICSAL